jgi:hypothetical protein
MIAPIVTIAVIAIMTVTIAEIAITTVTTVTTAEIAIMTVTIAVTAMVIAMVTEEIPPVAALIEHVIVGIVMVNLK